MDYEDFKQDEEERQNDNAEAFKRGETLFYIALVAMFVLGFCAELAIDCILGHVWILQ